MHNYGITPTNTGLSFGGGTFLLYGAIYLAMIGALLYGVYYLVKG